MLDYRLVFLLFFAFSFYLPELLPRMSGFRSFVFVFAVVLPSVNVHYARVRKAVNSDEAKTHRESRVFDPKPTASDSITQCGLVDEAVLDGDPKQRRNDFDLCTAWAKGLLIQENVTNLVRCLTLQLTTWLINN